MLNLTHVRSFVAVVDAGGFRGAARALHRSQPSITQHIVKLEGVLQATLLHRGRARSVVTAQGASFLPHARRLLAVAEDARMALDTERFALGASGNIATYLLPELLRGYCQRDGTRLPDTTWVGPNPELADRLCSGALDLALMEWWDERPGFTAGAWHTDRLVVIVAPDHPWAARRSVARKLLLATPLLAGESGSGTLSALRAVWGKDADRLRVSLTLGSTEAVKQAVRAGLGVSIVARSAVTEDVATGRLAVLDIAGPAVRKTLKAVIPEGGAAASAMALASYLVRTAGRRHGLPRARSRP